MRDEILDVLAWAAVFDHALNIGEIQRFLTKRASLSEIESSLFTINEAIRTGDRWHIRVSKFDPVKNKKRRLTAGLHLTEALPTIAKLCRTRAVIGLAVTGSVAAGSSDDDGDVDVLVVTKPGYVWRVRALAVFLEHNSPGKTRICPNMVLDCRDLRLRASTYAARELAMIRPVKGRGIFEGMIKQNPWFEATLPNATLCPSLDLPEPEGSYPSWWGVMRLPLLGMMAEKWESRRRIAQYKETSASLESVYDSLRCIGHEHAHRSKIEKKIAEIAKEVSRIDSRVQ